MVGDASCVDRHHKGTAWRGSRRNIASSGDCVKGDLIVIANVVDARLVTVVGLVVNRIRPNIGYRVIANDIRRSFVVCSRWSRVGAVACIVVEVDPNVVVKQRISFHIHIRN